MKNVNIIAVVSYGVKFTLLHLASFYVNTLLSALVITRQYLICRTLFTDNNATWEIVVFMFVYLGKWHCVVFALSVA